MKMQINKIPKKEIRTVVCTNCLVLRMAVIDMEECAKVGRLVAKPCPVCKSRNILIKPNKKKNDL